MTKFTGWAVDGRIKSNKLYFYEEMCMSSLLIVDKFLWWVVVLTVLPVKLYCSAYEVCHPSEVCYLHFMTK